MLDTFPERIKAAQQALAEVTDKVVSRRPSETPLSTVRTVGELMDLVNQVERGDQQGSDRHAEAIAEAARRRLMEAHRGKEAARNLLMETAPEPIRRRLAELREQSIGLARTVGAADEVKSLRVRVKELRGRPTN